MSGVPIVTYHAIGDGPGPLFTPIPVFEAHLRAFRSEGYRTMQLLELARLLKRGEEPPAGALVLTFDDAYQSVSREAWPRLRAEGFGATVFVISGFVGKDNRWPTQAASVPTASLMTWSEVASGIEQGMEIGAHTRTHAPLVRLTGEAADDEIRSSVSDIERNAGRRPSVFAYPYGASDAASARLVASLFEGCAGTTLGLVSAGTDPLALPRIDAFYLSEARISRLREPGFARELRIRQTLRSVKRRVFPDWR